MIYAAEAAEKVMNDWSTNESNSPDIVILPPNNFKSLTDDQEVQVMFVVRFNSKQCFQWLRQR